MTGPTKDDEEMKPEEIAAFARGLRRSALRNSEPEIVSTSNGHEAAAYQAAATAPLPATSKTVPTGGVRLSATLERDIAQIGKLAPSAGAAASLGETVPARRLPQREAPARSSAAVRALAIGSAIVLLLLLLLAAIAVWLVRSRPPTAAEAPAAPTVSTATTSSASAEPPSLAAPSSAPPPVTAVPTDVASAAPAASVRPAAPDRIRPAGRAPAAAPKPRASAGDDGSGGMIAPPL